MKLRFALMALAATALIGLAACGGDDDEPEPGATATETTTTAPSVDGGGAAGGGSTVSLAADPGGALEYQQETLEAEAGEVTIELTNESSVPHDVRVEDSGGEEIGGTSVITESEESATLDLEPADYTFFCSVAGHREAGMEGTLTVE